MLSVVFILAATLTLLPAVLAKLGPRVDKLSLPWAHSGEHRSPRFAAWGERLWRRPRRLRRRRRRRAGRAGHPGARAADRHAVDQGRARGRRLARRLHAGPAGVRHGRARRAAGRRARKPTPTRVAAIAKADPGVAQVMPRRCPAAATNVMVQVVPAHDPSDQAVGAHDRPPALRAPRRRARSAARSPRTTTSRRR